MQTVRNFFWKVTHPKAIKTLDTFIKLAVHRGVHHNDVLEEALEAYNRDYLKRHPRLHHPSLVSENNLLDMLARSGLSVSHTLLMKYKREDKMSCGDGPPLFYSNGTRVVYDWPLCRDWFAKKLAGA